MLNSKRGFTVPKVHTLTPVSVICSRSVVFNYRGCGGTKLSVSFMDLSSSLLVSHSLPSLQTPRLYSVGDVSDLTEVVDHIHCNNPSSPIVGVGISMGRYIGTISSKPVVYASTSLH